MAAEPEQIVRELEEHWRAALLAKDESALRAMIHPDYELVGVRANGFLKVGLDRWMEALGSMDVASLDMRILDTIAMPHTIVATVEGCWNVRYRGQTINERVLMTDVWVREDGPWQVIRRHSSLIPAGVEIN